MGRALLQGWLQAGVIDPHQVYICDKLTADETAEHFGAVAGSAAEIVGRSDVIVLGVKPQQLLDATRGLRFRTGQIVVSILAGTPESAVAAAVAPALAVRTMPNLSCGIGQGAALLHMPEASSHDRESIRKLFAAVGHVECLGDEDHFHAGTALSGSGPAYVFHAVEGMVMGGVRAGLSPEVALRLAVHTVIGAGGLMEASTEGPEALRVAVTSPAGTTEAALGVLARHDFTGVLAGAVEAAAHRSRELANIDD
jgi:pyrroline-5-carboxylate reductase